MCKFNATKQTNFKSKSCLFCYILQCFTHHRCATSTTLTFWVSPIQCGHHSGHYKNKQQTINVLITLTVCMIIFLIVIHIYDQSWFSLGSFCFIFYVPNEFVCFQLICLLFLPWCFLPTQCYQFSFFLFTACSYSVLNPGMNINSCLNQPTFKEPFLYDYSSLKKDIQFLLWAEQHQMPQ